MGLAEGFGIIFPSFLLQLLPGSECQRAGSTALLLKSSFGTALTDTQTKFPAAGSFPRMGALGSLCPPKVRALLPAKVLCHVPGLFRQQIPRFSCSLLMLHLQHRSREGICDTHSLLLQNREAFQNCVLITAGKRIGRAALIFNGLLNQVSR